MTPRKPLKFNKDICYPSALSNAKSTKCKIDENLHHRAKVVWRKRAVQKLQDDILNKDLIDENNWEENYPIPYYKFTTIYYKEGEYIKRIKEKERLRNRAWWCLWGFIIIVVIYGVLK